MLLIFLGILSISNEPIISTIILFIGCSCLLGYAFLFPSSYILDENGITVFYGFVIKTTAKWNELHTVEDHYCKGLFWMREYHIGYFKNTIPLWEIACIPKNKKTAGLVEKHYKNRIEKYG